MSAVTLPAARVDTRAEPQTLAPVSMRAANASNLRILYRSLTTALRTVAQGLQDFVSNPRAPVPEGLKEISRVAATMGLLSVHRFCELATKLAYEVREEQSPESLRLLAHAVNAVGVHIRSLSEGSVASYVALNKSFSRLLEGVEGGEAFRARSQAELCMPMFKALEASYGWVPPAGATRHQLRDLVRSSMGALAVMTEAELREFLKSLESRNTDLGVKVFLDAAICALEMEETPETALRAVAANLARLASDGKDSVGVSFGIDIFATSTILRTVFDAKLTSARAVNLVKNVIAEAAATSVNTEMARKFATGLDRFRDIFKKAAGSGNPQPVAEAVKQFVDSAPKLNSAIVTQLSGALYGAANSIRTAGHEHSLWIAGAMSIIVMRSAMDMASRGLAEDELLETCNEIAKRLDNSALDVMGSIPPLATMVAQVRLGAVASLCKEAELEILGAKNALDEVRRRAAVQLLPSDFVAEYRDRIGDSIRTLGGVLRTIGCPRVSMLCDRAIEKMGDDTTWSSPSGIQYITETVSVLSLLFSRMQGGSAHGLDELVSHEVLSVEPDLASTMAHAPNADLGGLTDGELLKVFIEEAFELISAAKSSLEGASASRVDAALVNVGLAAAPDVDATPDEAAPGDTAWVRDTMRLFHTLKGASRVAGLNALADSLERAQIAMEDFNDAVQDGLTPSIGQMAIAAQGVEVVTEWMQVLLSDREFVTSRFDLDALRHIEAINQDLEFEAAPEPQVAFEVEVEVVGKVASECESEPATPTETETETETASEHETSTAAAIAPIAVESPADADVAEIEDVAEVNAIDVGTEAEAEAEAEAAPALSGVTEVGTGTAPAEGLAALTDTAADGDLEPVGEGELTGTDEVTMISHEVIPSGHEVMANEHEVIEISDATEPALLTDAVGAGGPSAEEDGRETKAESVLTQAVGPDESSDVAFEAPGWTDCDPLLEMDLSDEIGDEESLIDCFTGDFTDESTGESTGELPGERPAADPIVIDVASLRNAIDLAVAGATDNFERMRDRQLLDTLSGEIDEITPQVLAITSGWVLGEATADGIVAVRRHVHTIKGGVRTAGMLRIGAALHALEDLLDDHEGREEGLLQGESSSALAQLFSEVMISTRDIVQDRAIRLSRGEVLRVDEVQADEVPAFEAGSDPVDMADSGVAAHGERSILVTPSREFASLPDTTPAAESVAAPVPELVTPEPAKTAIEIANGPNGGDAVTAVESFEQAPAAAHAAAPAKRKPLTKSQPTNLSHAVPGAMMRVAADTVASISRASGEAAVLQRLTADEIAGAWRGLKDLDVCLERIHGLMKDLEIEAEVRIEAGRAAGAEGAFDPLEFDRFTRLHEVTRSLTENVADITDCANTIGECLSRVNDAETLREVVSDGIQEEAARLMVSPLTAHKGRFDFVVSGACADTGKDAKVSLSGDAEAPGAVLDRLIPAIEHILRNCVAHGIESKSLRMASGKPASGNINIELSQSGAGLSIAISDDGAGVDEERVLAKAISKGIAKSIRKYTSDEILAMLFAPGLSTAGTVSQLSGRGVGLDAARTIVSEIGGQIKVTSTKARGTTFTVTAPSDISTMSAVPVRVASADFMLPSALVDRLSTAKSGALNLESGLGLTEIDGVKCRVVDFARMAGVTREGEVPAVVSLVLMGLGSADPVAFVFDSVEAQRKVVVRPLGRHISSIPGLVAGTVGADGAPVLIVNPLRMRDLGDAESSPVKRARVILLVDDSSTVRLATAQALRKAGFEVVTAKDGIDAMEILGKGLRPDAFALDLEMPRMDGFQLTGEIRQVDAFKDTPIFIVSSRVAQKHRDKVMALGATDFLGKPVNAEDLAERISVWAGRGATAAAQA